MGYIDHLKLKSCEEKYVRSKTRKRLKRNVKKALHASKSNCSSRLQDEKVKIETSGIVYFKDKHKLLNDHNYIESLTIRPDSLLDGSGPAVKATGSDVSKIRLMFKPISIQHFLSEFENCLSHFVKGITLPCDVDVKRLAARLLWDNLKVENFLYNTRFHSKVFNSVDDFYSRNTSREHEDIEATIRFRPHLDSVTYNFFIFYPNYFTTS